MPLFEGFPDWKPVSRVAGLAWLATYLLFLAYAALNRSGFLFVDYVNLMIHEGGHFFFSWFGDTARILGGTLGELIVPLLCAAAFWWRRETTAVAFCSFWFFENFLYIGTYMSDARTSALPLVGGDESDWTILFTQWGVLTRDLGALPGNRFEALLGDRKGQYSIRINGQWRISFAWPDRSPGPTDVEIVDYH